MEIKKGQIFNLWNTNGRRRDVLNALKIYLQILQEIRAEYPHTQWGSYPESIAQFVFYGKAIEYSPEVFKKHPKYDAFLSKLGDNYEAFVARRKRPAALGLSTGDMESLDKDIEIRARNHTSNLVKIGFSDSERNVSDVGAAFMDGYAERDELEQLLPIDNVNLILLRQLLKLKVFSEPNARKQRTFYSPVFMALLLLLRNGAIEKSVLLTVVQGLDPYLNAGQKNFLLDNLNDPEAIQEMVWDIDVNIPVSFTKDEALSFEEFSRHIKNQRGGGAVIVYYKFYQKLIKFRANLSNDSCSELMQYIKRHKSTLQKAFGCGKALFIWDDRNPPEVDEFLEQNRENRLLSGRNFNQEFYQAYCKSKRADSILEYSDTTERMLGATGIFKFGPLADVPLGEVLACLFDAGFLRCNVFGAVSEEEYRQYKESFNRNVTLSEILGYSGEAVTEIIARIGAIVDGETLKMIQAKIRSKTKNDFARHIRDKYPKEKILQLLPLFSDRSNDDKIKKEVNDTASVPTIYEYIIGIAWYYISNGNFDLYESLNLTMNADFEPVVHAGGGDGDIVIQYDDRAVMLEVTLMNKQAQKRAEWEPVLRHSLNLKAANEGKETVTYFIADELDYNTINIWRAVAAVPLESTNTHRLVDSVMIMPFTNSEFLGILNANISADSLLAAVKDSFGQVPKIADTEWKNSIMLGLGLEA